MKTDKKLVLTTFCLAKFFCPYAPVAYPSPILALSRVDEQQTLHRAAYGRGRGERRWVGGDTARWREAREGDVATWKVAHIRLVTWKKTHPTGHVKEVQVEGRQEAWFKHFTSLKHTIQRKYGSYHGSGAQENMAVNWDWGRCTHPLSFLVRIYV